MNIEYHRAKTTEFSGADSDFGITIEPEYLVGYPQEFDVMCDCYNRSRLALEYHKTGKAKVTLRRGYNCWVNAPRSEYIISIELAKSIVDYLENDDELSYWFAKDMLDYAKSKGELIGA